MTLLLLGWIAALLYLGILGAKVFLSLRYVGRYERGQISEGDITLLQPILSGDPALEETLSHNLDPAGANARFVWLIDEDDTVAQGVAQTIRGRSPENAGKIEVRLCPPAPEGVNPKTHKLSLALEAVSTAYVAVLDDDTRLAPGVLEAARHALAKADAYTGLPCYLPGTNFWSSLVSHFVNNNAIFTYLPLLNFSEPLSLNGMFYVMRTATLRGYGGFAAVLDRMTDDYAMARLIQERGGAIVQGIVPHQTHTTVPDAVAYCRLMHRWFVFARHQVLDQALGTQLLLGLLLALPPFLLWGLVIGWVTAFSLAGAGSLTLLIWLRHQLMRLAHRAVGEGSHLLSWPVSLLSELLQPFHLLHATLTRRIRWRSRLLLLERDGRCRPAFDAS